MSNLHRRNGFILVESMFCLLSLSAVSLALAQTIISGEKSVQICQDKLVEVQQENLQLKKRVAANEA